ncbi:hypothetical protein MUN81_13330 [Hymenobacter sp. 5317J-9]|uniref:hypothetical protein n=1 Tax=Hymenobacter sp. 5317J-9 TaxID=2932250 RepID=UPI001FD6DF14|nr:hypothetical protein [Hymenobacter sp. 5317J-9]UOQ96232.1 hypothetical protein MUN81_13330 [Hymenobacter sp. 5317J-9]
MQHSRIRRSLCVVLAVLVLITSVGLTVQRLTCRMSGRSTVAVSMAGPAELRGCTADMAPAAPAAKDNCCDFSKQLHKLSSPAHELAAKILVPTPQFAAVLPEHPRPLAGAFVARFSREPRWMAADASPPPKAGRTLLAFVCKLVV